MKKMMGGRKVLVVLDDVDDIDQLEALAGAPNWFKPGSRIIITSRDKQVLVAHRVNFIHDVNLLSSKEAICLFSKYASGREIPDQGYEELSGRVVQYAAGLPLTLKVLASHLCGRNEYEWVDAIERLKTIPLNKTLQRLELSYDGLENDQKEIFLDVVCLLKGESKEYAIMILESCGFNAQLGLSVLEQKSLITFSVTNRLQFHDHIEEMGWNIVRRLHPHSRLWIREKIEDILVHDLGTVETKYIKLKYTDLDLATFLKGIRNMKELRFLHVNGLCKKDDGVWEFLPETLRTLNWKGYPFCCLPKSFQANKLVNLEMPASCISHLWEVGEIKVLDKLKFLDLSFSKVTNLNVGMIPHIEKLNLQGCYDFVELQFPVECPKLKFIQLSNSKVSSLNLGMTPHLEELDLGGCYNFVELHLPVECPSLKALNLSRTKLRNLNLKMTPYLEKLVLKRCRKFVEIQFPVEFPKLKVLNLSYSKVSNLNLRMTPYLEKLYLQQCNEFVELHLPVEFPKLNIIDMSYSKVCNINLGMTPRLKELHLEGCKELLELHLPVECLNLRIIKLCGSKLRNLNLGMTPHLKELHLEGCNEFLELHLPFEFRELRYLNLSGSKVTNINLEMIPHLKELYLEGCYLLKEVHAPVGCLEKLFCLKLSNCLRFKHFLVETGLSSTNIFLCLGLKSTYPGCPVTLDLTVESLDECPLHPSSNLPKFQFTCKYYESRPLSSGNLEKLLSLGLCPCIQLESFSTSICSLQRIRVLRLKTSIPEVPKDLGQLESLEKLILTMENIKHLPNSICMLKHLKCLNLNFCWLLEELPNSLGRLEGLEELDLTNCQSLRDIPSSICNMKRLRHLRLPNCILVKELPGELGRLKCLQTLFVLGAGLSHLPQSIFQINGLDIIGSRWQLNSYGLTSLTQLYEDSNCYSFEVRFDQF